MAGYAKSMAQHTTIDNKEGLLDILNLAANYTTGATLCRLLPIADLISLTRTCRRLSSLYRDLLPSQWNIDKLLSRFLDNPRTFRGLMAKHNVLISGSLALQFFQRFTWSDSDMDVYVYAKGAREFEEYLCKTEGYRFEMSTYGERYDNRGIEEVGSSS